MAILSERKKNRQRCWQKIQPEPRNSLLQREKEGMTQRCFKLAAPGRKPEKGEKTGLGREEEEGRSRKGEDLGGSVGGGDCGSISPKERTSTAVRKENREGSIRI